MGLILEARSPTYFVSVAYWKAAFLHRSDVGRVDLQKSCRMDQILEDTSDQWRGVHMMIYQS